MKKIAKVFLRIIWVLIGIFCILLIPATIEQGEKYIFIGVIFLNAFWWISSVYVYKLSSFNKRKSYWNFKQEAVYEDYARSKESAFWYKIPKGAKIAAVSIWLLIGLMLLFLILSGCGGSQPSISSTEIFLSAGWLIITIGVVSVIGNAEKKTDKRLLELYDEKFLSELELCDDFLGTMLFRCDSYLGRLERASLNLPPFGTGAPFGLNISNYHEKDKDTIIGLLKELYSHSDEVLYNASEYACEVCKDIYDLDEEELDSKTIRENALVTDIDIVIGEKIKLHIYSDNGEENDFSSFTVTACIDIQEKSIDYDLID
ncbi:MAG: hypothetical protein K2J80_02810 [Oscillospiraceae bacterium]|nr:hypothetical protein [Oscillospiraceae bacterium]